jgi:hypothetical protein
LVAECRESIKEDGLICLERTKMKTKMEVPVNDKLAGAQRNQKGTGVDIRICLHIC